MKLVGGVKHSGPFRAGSFGGIPPPEFQKVGFREQGLEGHVNLGREPLCKLDKIPEHIAGSLMPHFDILLGPEEEKESFLRAEERPRVGRGLQVRFIVHALAPPHKMLDQGVPTSAHQVQCSGKICLDGERGEDEYRAEVHEHFESRGKCRHRGWAHQHAVVRFHGQLGGRRRSRGQPPQGQEQKLPAQRSEVLPQRDVRGNDFLVRAGFPGGHFDTGPEFVRLHARRSGGYDGPDVDPRCHLGRQYRPHGPALALAAVSGLLPGLLSRVPGLPRADADLVVVKIIVIVVGRAGSREPLP